MEGEQTADRKPTVRILIGAGQFDRIPALVAEAQLRRVTDRDVEVFHTFDKERPGGAKGRKSSDRPVYATDFSIVRFWLPELCGRKGKGIYIDSDMLFYRDPGELFDTDMEGLWVRHTPNQAAVLLCDCEALDWDAWALDQWVGHKSARYGQAMQSLCSTPADKIGTIDQRWNHTDHFQGAETWLLHYTRLRTQPWNYPKVHSLESLWWKACQEAVSDGAFPGDDPDLKALPAYEHAVTNRLFTPPRRRRRVKAKEDTEPVES